MGFTVHDRCLLRGTCFLFIKSGANSQSGKIH